MALPKHNISAETAVEMLNEGQSLKDFYISGELKIETLETWDKEIKIENCSVEYFSGSGTQFSKVVEFVNCHFQNCHFISSYFWGGLTIDHCKFDNYLDFQTGGHNKPGCSVIITNNDFADFVNFFDCQYESDVSVSNNTFHKGTNLLGKPNNTPVTFHVAPTINDNLGQLGFDHEGTDSES